MSVFNKMSSQHVGRQYLVCHTLVILLLQIFTSEAFRLWSPEAYGSKEARSQIPPETGVPHLASYTNPQAQFYVKPDTNKKLLVQQKLIAEQHLLHFGMRGHSPYPPQRHQSGFVPQTFPPEKHGNQFLLPEAAHEILLPTHQPSPATSTSNSPTFNSAPQTPAQKPDQNPSQDPAQNPENWQPSPSANQPEEGSSNPEAVTGSSNSGTRSAICYSRPDAGRCKGAFKRYYYNVTLDKCDCFFFGGCVDKASPVAGETYLASLEQCIKTCNPGNRLAGSTCTTALRPSLFFFDRTEEVKKTEGSQSWDAEHREESSATV